MISAPISFGVAKEPKYVRVNAVFGMGLHPRLAKLAGFALELSDLDADPEKLGVCADPRAYRASCLSRSREGLCTMIKWATGALTLMTRNIRCSA